MLDEDFRWEEYLAELALHRLRMFEDPLVEFDLAELCLQLLISRFNLSNCLTQILVDLYNLLIILILMEPPLVDCRHECLVHRFVLLYLSLRKCNLILQELSLLLPLGLLLLKANYHTTINRTLLIGLFNLFVVEIF